VIGTLAASSDVDFSAPLCALDSSVMTTSEKLLAVLEGIARRSAEAEGLSVAWCELKGGVDSRIFRVFIEREDGEVGLSDCERISKRLGLAMDVEDPIDSAYTLEVSSPGLDRPLHNEKDYQRFTGKLARLKTRHPIDGRKRFTGRIAGVVDGSVALDEDGVTINVPLSAVESGRLEVEIDPPGGASTRKRR
jgi:ribosome maturation factor RimP